MSEENEAKAEEFTSGWRRTGRIRRPTVRTTSAAIGTFYGSCGVSPRMDGRIMGRMTAALAVVWCGFPHPRRSPAACGRSAGGQSEQQMIEEAAGLPFDPDVAVWQSRALELCRVFEDAAEFVEERRRFRRCFGSVLSGIAGNGERAARRRP